MSSEATTKGKPGRKPERPDRVPMSAGAKLALDGTEQPEFHYRWVQDRDGRVEQAGRAWYEFDLDSEGNKKVVSSGPYPLYRMKIEKKYYDDDQDLKLKRSQDKIKLEQKISQGEYLPDDRSHAVQKDEYDPLG
jgi:hypothetical protein